jgi:hypothetical protein
MDSVPGLSRLSIVSGVIFPNEKGLRDRSKTSNSGKALMYSEVVPLTDDPAPGGWSGLFSIHEQQTV